jgi:hypothetical protein
MNEFATDPLEGHDSKDLEQRSVRALTEYMTVLSEGGDIYSVTTESGNSYRVDARKSRCTCKDYQYNLSDSEKCKHIRRYEFATGERKIPTWANDDAVDPRLGEHVDGNPRPVASDGGVSVSYPKGPTDEDTDTDDSESDDGSCLCDDTELGCFEHFQQDDEPRRSEPADFGGGESTGVQDL